MAVLLLLKLKRILIGSKKYSFVRFFLFLLLFSSVTFSQKKVMKKFQTALNKIEISTVGLDDLVIENSNSEFIEIYLYSENPNKNHIIFEEEYGVVKLRFNIPSFEREDKIFRKYITKRLNRARAIIKIPFNKNTTVFGENVGIESKDYNNNLVIYIENGNVKLNNVSSNILIKLYSGNVYASVNNTNLEVTSKNGKIKIDELLHQKKYQKKENQNKKKLKIVSIKANVFITSK